MRDEVFSTAIYPLVFPIATMVEFRRLTPGDFSMIFSKNVMILISDKCGVTRAILQRRAMGKERKNNAKYLSRLKLAELKAALRYSGRNCFSSLVCCSIGKSFRPIADRGLSRLGSMNTNPDSADEILLSSWNALTRFK